jgi:hypothetical protein
VCATASLAIVLRGEDEEDEDKHASKSGPITHTHQKKKKEQCKLLIISRVSYALCFLF